MKKIIVHLLIIIITAIASILSYYLLTSNDDPDSMEGVIYLKLFSKVLNEERELIVHLPRTYDSTKNYPVMYVLDGGSQDFHIAQKFDVLTTAGYAPETIIVGIPNMSGENREKNLTPPYLRRDNDDVNSKPGEANQFLQFIESELVPFIDQNYATSPYRMLCGNSRGGLLVMYSLIENPELFQARFCFSTPFWRQENLMIKKVDKFLTANDSLNTFLYLSAGENETDNIKNGLKNMTNTIRSKPGKIVLHSNFTPLAVHQNNASISASQAIARWGEHYKIEH